MPAVAEAYHPGQRLRVRGELWDIDAPPIESEGTQVLELRNVLQPLRTLQVIAEVEAIEVLPQAELGNAIGEYGHWRTFHDALLCTMQPPPGMLGALGQANVATEDYQLLPVVRAFERPMQRILIADDVGLGKTIEAILILLELKARSRADRILVVCPAGLQDQWADELREKAGLEFEIYDSAHVRGVREQVHVGQNPWTARRRIITSVDYVKRPEIKRMLRDVPWDVVIADEAHYLAETSSNQRTYRTERSRFAEFIARQADSLILLTATPHTGDPQSLFSLIGLLDPALIASTDALVHQRIAPVVVRRYKKDILDARGRRRFKDIDVRSVPVAFQDARERRLYDEVIKYCARRWKRERDTAVGFAMTVIKKRLISSRHALVRTLEERLASLSGETIDVDTRRGLLADYRAGVPLTEAQQAEAERRVIGAPPADAADRSRERKEIERLLRIAREIPPEVDSKALRLLEELNALGSGSATGRPEKAIVFTEFRDTHDYLLQFLEGRAYPHAVTTLTGAMTREERRAQIERFAQPGTMLLLATDAASEGLNLQEHCRTVLHYELPWNPNRLEQRNGRVYRWGQKHDVLVRNLIYEDTYDARILNLLIEKTENIRADLGSAGDVIGVMSSLPWEQLLMVAESVAPPDFSAREAAARTQIDRDAEEQRRKFLAFRERELGPTEAFGEAERELVERYRTRSQRRRLDAARRRHIVEWLVPLFGGRVTTGGGGLVAVELPQRLQRDLPARIDAAAFARDAIPEGRTDVAVLGMYHPLLMACGTEARSALYDATSQLAGSRIAAKIAATANAGVLYTFAVRYALGDGRTFAEELLPVFAPLTLPVSADEEADESLLAAEPTGGSLQAEHPLLQRLLEQRPDGAAAEALRRAARRAHAFEEEERARVATALTDLDRWLVARREWLDRELSLPVRAMQLELDEDAARRERVEHEIYERQRRRLSQQLELLDTTARQRRERLEQLSRVTPPARVDLAGALLVIPEYELTA